jgi:hypothetical protein
MTRTDLIYPVSTEEPAVAGIGCMGNHHLRDPVESINVNMGDPSDDAKERGSKELATALKTSEAPEGSQRGHSTRSAGKPRTWERAAPGEVGKVATTPMVSRKTPKR